MSPEKQQKSAKHKRILKKDFKHHFYFESYGVKICVTTNEAEALQEIKKIVKNNLLDSVQEIAETDVEHHFLLKRNPSRKDSLYKDGEKIVARATRKYAMERLDSTIRLTVAEFAVGRVFVHAGVVSLKGKALLIPARSFRGKTTLTAALVKRGALYYSDEYAVLDKDGFVHPFARPLSIRGEIDDFKQIDYAVETLGGTAGTEKIPVGMVLITEYKPNGKWKPKKMSSANGIIELINNTIPIRNNPQFSLEVLNRVANRAVFYKSKRGDVFESADLILDFFETNCF